MLKRILASTFGRKPSPAAKSPTEPGHSENWTIIPTPAFGRGVPPHQRETILRERATTMDARLVPSRSGRTSYFLVRADKSQDDLSHPS